MRIPYRQHWLLRRTNRRLRRSDPHLAAMLAIFARLYAAETIMSQEQAARPGARAWRRLAGLVKMMIRAVAGLIACAVRAFRRSVQAGATMRRQLGRVVRAALTIPPPAGPAVRRGDSGLPTG
jgi:hypothetical protein